MHFSRTCSVCSPRPKSKIYSPDPAPHIETRTFSEPSPVSYSLLTCRNYPAPGDEHSAILFEDTDTPSTHAARTDTLSAYGTGSSFGQLDTCCPDGSFAVLDDCYDPFYRNCSDIPPLGVSDLLRQRSITSEMEDILRGYAASQWHQFFFFFFPIYNNQMAYIHQKHSYSSQPRVWGTDNWPPCRCQTEKRQSPRAGPPTRRL